MLYNLFNILLSIGFVTCMHMPDWYSGPRDARWTDNDFALASEFDPQSLPTPSWVETWSQTNNLPESSQSSDMVFPRLGDTRELSQKVSNNVDKLFQKCSAKGFVRIEEVEFKDVHSKQKINGVNVHVYSPRRSNGQRAHLVRLAHANGGPAIDAGAIKAPLHIVFNLFYERIFECLSELSLTFDESSEKLGAAASWLWDILTKQESRGSIPVIGFIDPDTVSGKVYKLTWYQASLINVISWYKIADPKEWQEATSKFVDELALCYKVIYLPKPVSRP